MSSGQFLLFPLLSWVAFGGQSLTVSTATVQNLSVPTQAPTSPCRMEFSIHDWTPSTPSNSRPVEGGACNFNVQFLSLGPNDLRLSIFQTQSRGINYHGCQIFLNQITTDTRFANVRYQHIPAAKDATSGEETCEAWDIEGRRFFFETNSYTGVVDQNLSQGASIYGAGPPVSIAYFRLFTTTVAPGTRPPVTADIGDLLEWKFDGNLSDSSGHNYNGTHLGGLYTYTPTPGQDLVVAIVRTADAPAWSDWSTLRAGYSNQLDCSSSYSQADSSASVTCEWSGTGPTSPIWNNPTSTHPDVSGLSFGTYKFELKVTDSRGKTARTTSGIGAVYYDENGVVIPSNPAVTQIFGPMIAFGKNPWGYADERAKRMVELQYEYFRKAKMDSPTWAVPGVGTVSYPFSGIGPPISRGGTNLTSQISRQQYSIPIEDASQLPSLATLPTWLVIGSSWGTPELIRVCSTSATSGPATLSVCYDGRGLSGASVTISPIDWPQGASVGEYRVQGSGTKFVSDSNSPICPGGAPGPPGPVIYSTGAVNLSGGISRITGTNGTWNTGNISPNMFIRIDARHGGQPFVYWSRIASVDAEQTISVDRPLPTDTDSGVYAYKIIGYRYAALEFVAPDGVIQSGLQLTQGCESETAFFASPMHDLPGVTATYITGVRYSYKDSLGAQSAYGPNFYGSGMAARALYFRTGWDFAKQTADMIDEYWVRDPEIAGGWRGGYTLLQGGGAIGAIADLVTNPDTKLRWSDVRAFATRIVGTAQYSCDDVDARDSGYFLGFLALFANYDPDATQQAKWQQALDATLTRDTNCRGEDFSWANGYAFNWSSPVMTLTNGSDIAQGTAFRPDMCYGFATGRIEVTNGSAEIRAAGLVNGAKIVISGTKNGQPFVGMYQFWSAGSAGILSVLWPGDTGTADFMIENNWNVTTIGGWKQDPQLRKNWACQYISPRELKLNRAWDGDSTTTAYMYSYTLAGFGQQPFMLGVKTTAMLWASQNRASNIALKYGELASGAATWMRTTGFDPATLGLHYGRLYGACEPVADATPATSFAYRTPGCSFGLDPASIRAARTLTAEATSALTAYHASNRTAESRAWGDQAYGAIWGYCPYTKPGFYCDPYFVKDENSDTALAGYKWPGFFFGMGMAHQWPAVRSIAALPEWLGRLKPATMPSTGLPAVDSADLVYGLNGKATLTVKFSHSAGAAALSTVSALLSPDGSPNSACLISYNPILNVFTLANNNPTTGSTTITLGSGNAQNSQCQLRGSGSSRTIVGNELTLTLSLVLNSGFPGNGNVYLYAADTRSNTGWVLKQGASIVTADSVSPSSNIGASQVFEFVFSDTKDVNNVQAAAMLIGTDNSGINACWLVFDRNRNTISLLSDDAKGSSAKSFGSSLNIKNSQCALGAPSLGTSGNSTILTIPLAFYGKFTGPKKIYMYAVGPNGNTGWVERGSFNVLAGGVPVAQSVMPSSGSALNQTFTFTIADNGGSNFLLVAAMLFSRASNFDLNNGCYIVWEKTTNRFSLFQDLYANGANSLNVGSSGLLENSQCTLDGLGSSVIIGSTTITITLNLTFNASFAGNKNSFLYASENAYNSGWRQVGTWTVPGSSPTINSLAPASGSGSTNTFTMSATTPVSPSDVTDMTMLVTAAGTSNSCHVRYDRATATIRLYDDAGTSYATKPLGSSAALQNSQCAIGYSVATFSGGTINVSVQIVFKAAFRGVKTISVGAENTWGITSPVSRGTWTVP